MEVSRSLTGGLQGKCPYAAVTSPVGKDVRLHDQAMLDSQLRSRDKEAVGHFMAIHAALLASLMLVDHINLTTLPSNLLCECPITDDSNSNTEMLYNLYLTAVGRLLDIILLHYELPSSVALAGAGLGEGGGLGAGVVRAGAAYVEVREAGSHVICA